MTSKIVFIDTSFFKALIDIKDDFHASALSWWNTKSVHSSIEYCTSNFILDEMFTVLRVKCSKEIAFEARAVIAGADPSIKIIKVITKDEKNAWQWFEKDWSGLSFTDCVTFAQMERLGIKNVATFDKHFQQAGFTIVH